MDLLWRLGGLGLRPGTTWCFAVELVGWFCLFAVVGLSVPFGANENLSFLPSWPSS